MECNETTKRNNWFKKMIGMAILLAAVIYCFPELQEKIRSAITVLKNEWRDTK